MTAPLLDIEDLTVRFAAARGEVAALRGIGFTMGREKLGLVGESGSGKSTLARAILRLTPGRIEARRLEFYGRDLLACPARALRRLRGAEIGFVPQDPAFALNPVLSVGEQIVEVLHAHGRWSRRSARERALARLKEVGLREPEHVYRARAHELSGGMGQRVAIAMATIAEPKLLIADEPTSALDAGVRLKVLDLIDEMAARHGMGVLFISHDLDLVGGFCHRVIVLHAGQIVESLDAAALEEARHPYTRGLLAARPRLDAPRDVLPVLARDAAWLESDASAGGA